MMTQALLPLLLLATAPRAAEPSSPPAGAPAPFMVEGAAAVVNGQAIMLSEYQKEAATTAAYLRRTNPAALADPVVMREVRENALEELITRELLVQVGKRTGLEVSERDRDDAVEEIKSRFKDGDAAGGAKARTSTPAPRRPLLAKLKADGVDFAQFRAGLADDILARKVIARDVTAKVPAPTGEETRAYFEKIRGYLASKSTSIPVGIDPEDGAALREAALRVKSLSAEAVRVGRILIRMSSPATEIEMKRALKSARALKARLDAGEDFEKLARAESEDAESAPRGGDFGYVARGDYSPDLEAAVFALPVGHPSEPTLTEAGFEILRVTEKRAAKAPEYADFKGDLATFLDGLARGKKLRSYLTELRSKAVIERHLPPSP